MRKFTHDINVKPASVLCTQDNIDYLITRAMGAGAADVEVLGDLYERTHDPSFTLVVAIEADDRPAASDIIGAVVSAVSADEHFYVTSHGPLVDA